MFKIFKSFIDVRYINLDPSRVSTGESLKELGYYRWNGHSVSIGKDRNECQKRDYVLGQFGKGRSKAIRTYRQFMEEGKDAGRRTAEKEVSTLRTRIAHLLCREMGISVAEAARKLGGGAPRRLLWQ